MDELIKRLRFSAKSAAQAAEEIDPEHYDPDEPESIAIGLEFQAELNTAAADAIETAVARIAALEAQIAAAEKQEPVAMTPERIDWIANAHCPNGVAYPDNVKRAIRDALREAAPLPSDGKDAERYRWLIKNAEEIYVLDSEKRGVNLDLDPHYIGMEKVFERANVFIDAEIAKQQEG